MGEYAKLKGSGAEVKIGTCEQMYYLRWDQADQVWAQHGNVDPVRDRFDGIRFRFPFPDEDRIQPGEFEDYDRAFRIDGIEQTDDHEHYHVQFKASNGYLLSIPCPESGTRSADRMSLRVDVAGGSVKVGLNGYGGSFGIHSQRWLREDEDGPERLVTVCRCLGCGALWRLHTWEQAEPIVVALRAQADEWQRRTDADMPAYGASAATLHEIADRIRDGYQLAQVAASLSR